MGGTVLVQGYSCVCSPKGMQVTRKVDCLYQFAYFLSVISLVALYLFLFHQATQANFCDKFCGILSVCFFLPLILLINIPLGESISVERGKNLRVQRKRLFCDGTRQEILLESIIDFCLYRVDPQDESCYRLKAIHENYGTLSEITLLECAPRETAEKILRKLRDYKEPFTASVSLTKKILKGCPVREMLKSLNTTLFGPEKIVRG